MNDLEDRLQSVLAERAGAVEDVDPAGRAGLVVHRGGRVRRRRTVGAAVAVLLVVAGGAGLAVQTQPASRPVGVPAAATPAAASSAPGSSGRLASGPASASTQPSPTTVQQPSSGSSGAVASDSASSAVKGVLTGNVLYLVTPSGRVRLPDPGQDIRNADVVEIVPVADGWVVETQSQDFTGGGPDAGSQVLHVTTTGQVTRWGLDSVAYLVVSPDRSQVAWLKQAGTTADTPLVVVHDATGSGRHDWPVISNERQAISLQVTGWDAQGVAVSMPNTDGQSPMHTVHVNPSTGAMT